MVMQFCHCKFIIMRKILVLVPASFFITAPLLAQFGDSTKPKELNEVIVTGQYKPQSAKSSVYQVRTISKERILQQGATKLQDVLNSELNIRFSQDLSTGGSDITMLGLKGQNVKILIDGLPMTGRQGTSNEININQVDINSIERIEIVEGPMSVVYGADALAGVINIITKKTATAGFTVMAKVQEETIGNEYGIKQGIHNQYAGFTWKKQAWEAGASLSHNFFGGWKDTAVDRELVWHKKDQRIANGFIAYTKGKLAIRYRLDGLDEIITNPGNFLFRQQDSGDTLANDQEYLTRRLMHQLHSSYYVSNNLNFQLQSSYTNYSRQVFSTTVSKETGAVRLDRGEGRQSTVHFKGFTFRGTAVYKLSPIVSLQPGIDINLDRGTGERLKTGNNKVDDYAFFLTAELTPSAKINIRPGLRVIKNSVYDAPPVIPSLNTKLVLGKNLDLRLAYARGFRSPSLRELYFNFVDASHLIIGNPNLKAETSHSVTGSLNWKKTTTKQVTYTTVLGGFYNSVKDMIDYLFTAATDTVFMTNIFSSKTAGANLTTMLRYKKWNISVGGSYTGFYNDYVADDASLPTLQWSAEANANIGYHFSKAGLDVNLFYKFTGKRPYYATNSNQEVVLTHQQGYHMADITVTKKAFHYFSFNAGIRNLFDVTRITSSYASGGVHSAGGTRNIGCGRSFFAGVNFNWN